jgi:hypothetical protein
MLDDEKKSLKKKKKKQVSLGEPCKPGLISQTCNLLNFRPMLNLKAQCRNN